MPNLIKARGVIKQGNKIFLVKDSRCHQFFLPGGTQEEGETIQECFYREIEEELGVAPIAGEVLKVIENKNRHDHSSVEFLFEVLNPKDFQNVIKENCSHGDEWLECGFYDLNTMKRKDLRPNNLPEILTTDLIVQII